MYAAAGNIVEAEDGASEIGDNNQLLSDGTYSYIYDAEGNLAAKYIDADADGVLDAGDTDITEYAWDYRNRLTEATHKAIFGGNADWTAEYQYDALDHRIASVYDDAVAVRVAVVGRGVVGNPRQPAERVVLVGDRIDYVSERIEPVSPRSRDRDCRTRRS